MLVTAERPTRAADPQPYNVTIAPTGNAALDTALKDSSSLISLRESAPVGAFALIGRAQQDQARFATALGSFGYYKGKAAVTIAGHPLDDPALPDLLDRAPADPPVEIKVTADTGPLFHLGQVKLDGDGTGGGAGETRSRPGRAGHRLADRRRPRAPAGCHARRRVCARQG